jgi:hypothetical protein
MKRWLTVLLTVVLLGGLAGCSSEKEKGLHRDRDKPKAPGQ